MTHELKCRPAFFKAIYDGRKLFEVRLDDRAYQESDVLILREWRPMNISDYANAGKYTGRRYRARVSYVMKGGQFGIDPRYVVLSLADGMRLDREKAKEYIRNYGE